MFQTARSINRVQKNVDRHFTRAHVDWKLATAAIEELIDDIRAEPAHFLLERVAKATAFARITCRKAMSLYLSRVGGGSALARKQLASRAPLSTANRKGTPLLDYDRGRSPGIA